MHQTTPKQFQRQVMTLLLVRETCALRNVPPEVMFHIFRTLPSRNVLPPPAPSLCRARQPPLNYSTEYVLVCGFSPKLYGVPEGTSATCATM